MELRIVELAHSKGLTITDIANQLGISRVNLSNSLNGNPTLSRLTAVAKVLNVEISELFKPAPSTELVTGYLEYKGCIIKINSIDAIKKFIEDIETSSNKDKE